MILFDTDAISELMRKRPSPRLVRRLGDVPVREQATSAITIGELCYGAFRANRPDLFETALRLLAGVRVLDFDAQAARAYGPLRSLLEKNGTRLDEPDLRIASIAIAHKAHLVTGNLRHFSRIPNLVAEDWIRS